MRHFFKLKLFFYKVGKKTFRHLSSSRVVLISAMLPCRHALPPLHSWTSLGSSSDNATRTRGDTNSAASASTWRSVSVRNAKALRSHSLPNTRAACAPEAAALQGRVASSAPTRVPCPALGLHISPSITTVVRVRVVVERPLISLGENLSGKV